MALLAKVGYGQVEINKMEAQKTGAINAQLPVDPRVFDTLEGKGQPRAIQNGMFMDYDYGVEVQGISNYNGAGAVKLPAVQGGTDLTGLVYNEIILFIEWHTCKDFALTEQDATNYIQANGVARKTVFPRLYTPAPGDVITTNLVATEAGIEGSAVQIGEFAVGDLLTPNTDGFLQKITADNGEKIIYRVVKVYTMADLQPALKLACIKA
jgi:hypothetical protein